MRVLTYNIAGHKGKQRPAYIPQIADLIQDLGADVVGLQEVVHFDGDDHPPDVRLCELTGMHAEFLPAHRHKSYTIGNAILTREPIVECLASELPYSWPERRILMEVRSTLGGLPITVFCTHLVHMAGVARRFRLAQVTAVARRMETCWRPHVLVGDLNAGPNSRELRPMRTLCVRHDHLRGLRSWPSRRPMILYDHIWPGPGWVVKETKVLDPHISDHRPLFAELAWDGTPQPGAPSARAAKSA
jgi:endonuclease/exonuclease/phosphatase family metal-dependent hydrolase